MEGSPTSSSSPAHQQDQTVEFTYIGKYGCQNEYLSLKTCMREAEPAKIKSMCDHHYEKIGKCIITKFKES
jgi:hypothetical protein